MPKLSVCIEMFWRDLPFGERVRRAAALDYTAFEFWGWKNKDLDEIRAARDETGLLVAAICTEPNFCLVERIEDQELSAGLRETLNVARTLGCPRLIITAGNALADETFETTRRRVVRRLKQMAPICEDGGLFLVLEPLNALVDHPGSWLTRMFEAADIVQEVDSPNVKILDDLYHQQLSEGNLIANLTRYAPWIGHFHAAGAPGRHELVGGELDYQSIFAAIDRTGYTGYVGVEFTPTMGAEAALQQALTLAD
jgi:hydroxypyruvate isomerase